LQSRQIRLAHHLPTGQDLSPDLAAVISAWPDLPEPIRAAIRALIAAATVGTSP